MKRVKRIIHCPGNNSGEDVVIAVLDTGAAKHPELQDRFLVFRDFLFGKEKFYDDNGHGTHVCGIIAGNTIGIAPQSKLVVLKVLDDIGNGSVEATLRAFRWILENREKYNIQIVNISMGMKKQNDMQKEQQILKGVELLWDMGLIVVAAAGNQGPRLGSITVPGVVQKIITVGAYDLKKSGRGIWEKNMQKPDLVVPGNRVVSCNVKWKEAGQKLLVEKSGTSMAAPIVSGAIANLLEQERYLSNESVKTRIKASCKDLRLNRNWQGNGLLDMIKLLK